MAPHIPKAPNLSDPEFAGAVDLDKVREDTEREQADREHRQRLAAEQRAAAWYRNMNRAFKGIYPKDRRRKDHLRMIERDHD
jgi:hypothetical protein